MLPNTNRAMLYCLCEKLKGRGGGPESRCSALPLAAESSVACWGLNRVRRELRSPWASEPTPESARDATSPTFIRCSPPLGGITLSTCRT